MNEPRTFASLSPTLLARKGSARPAMRPQLTPLQQFHEGTARQIEDLGWNDMGNDAGEGAGPAHKGRIVPLKDADNSEAMDKATDASSTDTAIVDPPSVSVDTLLAPAEQAHVPPEKPAVLRQREVAVASIARMNTRRSALAEGRRAAFTLRLDAERHLRLRLACAVGNRSAQQIVTEALDRLLEEMPEIAALAERARKRG